MKRLSDPVERGDTHLREAPGGCHLVKRSCDVDVMVEANPENDKESSF